VHYAASKGKLEVLKKLIASRVCTAGLALLGWHFWFGTFGLALFGWHFLVGTFGLALLGWHFWVGTFGLALFTLFCSQNTS
jgi:hypothetical protein